MTPSLGRLTVYTHRIPEMVAFYSRHFGFVANPCPDPRMVELTGPGAAIRLHPAAKAQKMGQVLVKLVFDVENVEDFCRKAKAEGLIFGKIHKGDGYCFANAKDPSGNSVCVSIAAFVQRADKRTALDDDVLNEREQPRPQERENY